MISKLVSLYGFSKAPKYYFVARHPIKTFRLLTNAIVALPLGFYLGRKSKKCKCRCHKQ